MVFRNFIYLIKDTLTYGASNALAQVIGLLLLPIYTQYLSPADYGLTALLAIITLIFSPLARLGITNAIFRRYNIEKDQRKKELVLSTGLVSVLVSGTLMMIIGLAFAPLISKLLVSNTDQTLLVRLTIISAALSVFSSAPNVTLRANRKVKLVAGLNLSRIIISVLFNIYFVVVRGAGVLGIVLGTLFAEAICFVIALWVTRNSWKLEFDLKSWKAMASYGLPFVPHHLQAVGLSMMSQYMVAHFMGLSQAGLYSLALRISAPLGMIVSAIQQAWVPLKFQIHAQEKNAAEIFRSITTYYFALTSFFWLGCSLFGPEVLRLMTTTDFHEAASLIPIVSFIPFAQGTYWMIGTGFEMGDDTRSLPVISLLGLLTVIACSFWLTPLWGAKGAALTSIIGWLVMAASIFKVAHKNFPVNQAWTLILGFVSLSSVLILTSSYFDQFSILIRLAYDLAASATYIGLVFLFMFHSKSERGRALELWKRLRKTRPKTLEAQA